MVAAFDELLPTDRRCREKTPLFCEALSISGLLLSLFMRRVTPTPFAILLKLYFALYKLFVLARPIVGAAALTACDFYELILRHRKNICVFVCKCKPLSKLGDYCQ